MCAIDTAGARSSLSSPYIAWRMVRLTVVDMLIDEGYARWIKETLKQHLTLQTVIGDLRTLQAEINQANNDRGSRVI